MIEPSDLYASVNRLLVGIGQILTAAVLLAMVVWCAAMTGNMPARNCAVIALGLTTVGYALQLMRMTSVVSGLVFANVVASWFTGAASVGLLIMGK